MPMGEMVLEVTDVSEDALESVSIEVERGDFLVVLGPSGSGKKTLFDLVSGTKPLQSGRIRVGGRDITEIQNFNEWRASNIGCILQENNLIPTLKADENVELPLLTGSVRKKERRDRALKALDRVGLRDMAGTSSSKLTMEQAQRVALARAMAADPTIILAYEPTGRLARGDTEGLIKVMSDLNKEDGYTFIVATHDNAFRRVASKVLDLSQ
jgi:putative ABC transport system ATP-binding protein